MISAILALLMLVANPVAEIPKPPTASPPGVVSVWGSPALEKSARSWAEEFEKQNPEIRVEINLTGSDIGLAALYTGLADIALIGRTPTSSEAKAFEWIFRYQPTLIPLARGSVATPGQSPSIAILVNSSNPIRSLNADQLKMVLLNKGLTWGGLGVPGVRSDRPVRVYMPHVESGTGRFILEALVEGDIRLDWERVTEFYDSGGMGYQDTASIESSLPVQGDLDGIAFGVSGIEGTVQVEAPYDVSLERFAYAAVNIPPNKCADPEVRLFLSFAKSQAGTTIIERESGFRALPNGFSGDLSMCVPKSAH